MPEPSPELLDELLLSLVEGIGPRTYRLLLERFGSVTKILSATSGELKQFNFHIPGTAERIVSARNRIDPTAVCELCRREGINIVSVRDKNYPEQLKSIHDPPPILYVFGSMLPQDAFSIAVVGTRRMTSYGERQTERLTTAISHAGMTVLSGLALGIDTIAHRAALDAGGRTIGVIGSGLLRFYPPQNRELARRIVESGGAVISELPPLHESARWAFPQRNRIVTGLSLGVLVIEAPLRSGAMISARLAGEQGRDIFAVPGSIESDASRGTNQLIRDGAYLTESVDDIVNVLGPMSRSVPLPCRPDAIRHPNEISLNEIEQFVLRQIKTVPTTIKSIEGLAPHQIHAALGTLEEKRIIRRVSTTAVVRM